MYIKNMNSKWYTELEEYIKQNEPDKAEKSSIWKTAIGLQDVDNLKTSDYLLETVKEHIDGNIKLSDVKNRIQNYYEIRSNREKTEDSTIEADIVSTRIADVLSEKTFQFSPAEWISIHRRLFDGVFSHAGKIRNYNISKKEWVLNGESVFYASYNSIKDSIDYDFNNEKNFSYSNLALNESIKHISKFTSDIWQIHPFEEGNTRATAVFIIKYLISFGFPIANEIFANNSWYFRNALVRANYSNLPKNIAATTKYLEMFYENLLLNTKHELKNRFLHVDYNNKIEEKEPTEVSKSKICTLNCTLEEMALLRAILSNNKITQKELAKIINKSERTVKTITVELQKKGYLSRENGKRNGSWKVLVDL